MSVVHDVKTSANNLNNDLSKTNDWAIPWKMSSNLIQVIQAHEVLFSRKHQNLNHDSIYFNHNIVQVPLHKHLGMRLDTKLNFLEHLDKIMSEVDKTIGLLGKLQAILPRPSLVTNYKAFIRPHLDCWG